jgi:hypothetical protein
MRGPVILDRECLPLTVATRAATHASPEHAYLIVIRFIRDGMAHTAARPVTPRRAREFCLKHKLPEPQPC